LKGWKNKFSKFLNGRYGVDELGRAMSLFGVIVYIVGVLLKNAGLALVGMTILLVFAFRALSGDKWDRSDENRKYMSYLKLWKLRYENRKMSRVYLCDRCGRYIRVPKGRGKIQITCPGCGRRIIRKT
jgi:DNA-directed RNA polymerase subunit RPC12/RpoP